MGPSQPRLTMIDYEWVKCCPNAGKVVVNLRRHQVETEWRSGSFLVFGRTFTSSSGSFVRSMTTFRRDGFARLQAPSRPLEHLHKPGLGINS
jgi:hypothetical protein